jgi:hypothetical protein
MANAPSKKINGDHALFQNDDKPRAAQGGGRDGAPPAATSGGRPVTPERSNGGNDFGKNPRGSMPHQAGRNFITESRKQAPEGPPTAPPPSQLGPMRAQTMGDSMGRDPASIPQGGITPRLTAPASRAGTGSIGNGDVPWKGLK